MYEPGLAPIKLDFTTKEMNESQALAAEYVTLAGKSSPANFSDYTKFSSNLRVLFLLKLTDLTLALDDTATKAIMTKIDQDLKISETLDPECKQVWFPLGIVKGYSVVVPKAKEFVSTMGRWKYVAPMYTALLDTKQKALANTWFDENKTFYHPYVVQQLTKLINSYHDEQIAFLQ